jgi:hypothetical protein
VKKLADIQVFLITFAALFKFEPKLLQPCIA